MALSPPPSLLSAVRSDASALAPESDTDWNVSCPASKSLGRIFASFNISPITVPLKAADVVAVTLVLFKSAKKSKAEILAVASFGNL